MTGAGISGGASVELELDGRLVRVSNPDRVLWPETGFTKRDMIEYYVAAAPAILPHIRDRAITLGRWPEGVDRPGWFQVNCRGHPDWLGVHEIVGRHGATLRYCVVEDAAGLAWLANLGTIELHPFLWRLDSPSRPDVLVVDLDPGPPASLLDACRVGLLVRDELGKLGLQAWPKVSGSLGLHLYAPVGPQATFERTKALARSLAATLAARYPDLVVDRNVRAERRGRVYIDWIQNDASRSTVAPYSLRATAVPFVSTPVTWAEVEAAVRLGRDDGLRFGPEQALERLSSAGDLFDPILASR